MGIASGYTDVLTAEHRSRNVLCKLRLHVQTYFGRDYKGLVEIQDRFNKSGSE